MSTRTARAKGVEWPGPQRGRVRYVQAGTVWFANGFANEEARA